MSFRKKLVLLLVLFTGIPLLAVSVLNYQLMRESIYHQLEEDHLNLATAAAEHVADYINNLEERLSMSAKSRRFDEGLNKQKSITFLKEHYPTIDYMHFINPAGKVIASAPQDFDGNKEFSNRFWFQNIKNQSKSYLSHASIISDTNQKPMIFMAIPVYNGNGIFIGVLGAEISLEKITNLAGKLKFSQTGKVIVTDSNDIIIANPNPKKVLAREKIILESIRPIKNHKVFTYNYNGIDNLMVFRTLNSGWTVYVMQEEQEALIPLIKLQRQIFVIAIITFILSIGAIIIITRHFLRPISALHQGAQEIKKGNFGFQVKLFSKLKLFSKDEISYLIRAFNEMSIRLKGYTEEIRAKAEVSLKLYEFKQDFLDMLFLKNNFNDRREVFLLQEGLSKIKEILRLDNSAIFWEKPNSPCSSVIIDFNKALLNEVRIYCKHKGSDYEGEVIYFGSQPDHILLSKVKEYISNPDFLIICTVNIEGIKGYFVTITTLTRNTLPQDIKLLNTLVQILSMVLEIDHQKELNLKTSKELNLVLNTVSDGIVTTNLNSQINSVNQAFCNIFGAQRQEIIGLSVSEFAENYLRGNQCILAKTLETKTEILDWETDYYLKGERISILASSHFLKKPNGEAIGVLAILKNVTKKKELEEQIRLTEKFSAIGQLAAGLAHEIKNPMTSIKGFMQLMNLGKDNLLSQDHIDLMLKELDRINVLLNDFLRLAKPKTPNIVECNVGDLVLEILSLKKLEFKARKIETTLIGFESPLLVAADTNQLKQILINVIHNAYEAMQNGGNLSLKAYIKDDLMNLEVIDQGDGIHEEILSKIFDPFFTTKENGTGLGLAISYQIMERMGGKIQVFNNANGIGATFVIQLPLFL